MWSDELLLFDVLKYLGHVCVCNVFPTSEGRPHSLRLWGSCFNPTPPYGHARLPSVQVPLESNPFYLVK